MTICFERAFRPITIINMAKVLATSGRSNGKQLVAKLAKRKEGPTAGTYVSNNWNFWTGRHVGFSEIRIPKK